MNYELLTYVSGQAKWFIPVGALLWCTIAQAYTRHEAITRGDPYLPNVNISTWLAYKMIHRTFNNNILPMVASNYLQAHFQVHLVFKLIREFIIY